MLRLVRSLAATVVLSTVAAFPAFAVFTLPSTGNSSASLSILDPKNSVSLVVSLNVTLNDLLPEILATPAGFNIANAIREADRAAVGDFLASASASTTWWVGAFDSASNPEASQFNGLRIASTYNAAVASIPTFTRAGVGSAVSAAQNFYNVLNSTCGFADVCPGNTTTQSGVYAGNEIIWGPRYGNFLPPIGNGQPIGTAQAFYFWATPETGPVSSLGNVAIRESYRNETGLGLWNLTLQGGNAVLSYALAAVPLPAAAWLFLSGLLGFATVARRRKTAAGGPVLATA